MIKLSIVVPVYNVEKYLIRCLESLKDLKIENEIIIVNDGSTDSSLKLAEEFKEMNESENIKIVTQENKGLSEARNTGLKISKGEYISFIDSDDFIIKEKYERLIENTINDKLDIGIGNAVYYYEDEQEKNNVFYRSRDIVDKKIDKGIIWMEILNNNSSYRAEVWDDIYRRKFLIENDIYFIPGRLHEDHMFTLNVFLKAERVKYFDLTFYNYVQRDNSIMTTKKIKNYEDMKQTLDETKEISKEYESETGLRRFFSENLHNLYKVVLDGYYYLDKKKYGEVRKEYMSFYYKSMLLKKIKLRYKLEGLFLLINHRVFEKIRKMVKG